MPINATLSLSKVKRSTIDALGIIHLPCAEENSVVDASTTDINGGTTDGVR